VSNDDFEQVLAALTARGPGRMLPDLDRITSLAGLMGDPQLAYPTVHVTGTNGKGSIVRMVGALCSAAGLSAGTYTSPHLQSVRERFGLAGRPIGPQRFADVHREVAQLAELVDEQIAAAWSGDGEPDRVTYFELLTAMAFWWFADVPVDVGVVEVGMGGRWDATNLVRGDVAVLGPIDLDHTELGSTPQEVAGEKVGIIKPGSQVVTARQTPEVDAIIDAAVEQAGATVWRVGDDVEVVERAVAVGGQLLELRVGERTIDEVLLPVYGAHQAENAALALAAFAALTGDAFAAMEDDVIRHGLGAVTIPGRLEIVRRDPTIVLDGAHNPHGARAAAEALQESFGFRELVLVTACFDDKDIAGILGAFAGAASHVVVTRVEHPRAASLERMRAVAMEVWGDSGTVVEVATDIRSALTLAESVAREGDGILVAGSLLTVGAARDRYLPIGDGSDDDAVVREPDDIDGDDDELLDVLEDDEAFEAAIEQMLDAAPDVGAGPDPDHDDTP
jgi:dihydrofolate synthase / folylpolyglutamate synthase